MAALKFSVLLALIVALSASAFTVPTPQASSLMTQSRYAPVRTNFMAKEDEVVELVEEEETEAPKKEEAAVAPFLSQGEVSEEAMEMDFSDPKQARVMIYIILSLLPVLFLIPLMLGSREMIPAEMLPPVEI